MLKNALIICFSLLICSGCTTTSDTSGMVWPEPPRPDLSEVTFINTDEGFLLTIDEATKLSDNFDELKAHIEKLEILIKTMKEYYKAK